MDCGHAKQLIDERLDAERAERSAADDTQPRDWSALDAHLAGCPACAAEWRELSRTRDLVAAVADDRPKPVEIDNMWAAIHAGTPWSETLKGDVQEALRFWRRPVWRLTITGAGIAAVLTLAFGLGAQRFGAPMGIFALSRAREAAKLQPTLEEQASLYGAFRRGEAKLQGSNSPSSGETIDPGSFEWPSSRANALNGADRLRAATEAPGASFLGFPPIAGPNNGAVAMTLSPQDAARLRSLGYVGGVEADGDGVKDAKANWEPSAGQQTVLGAPLTMTPPTRDQSRNLRFTQNAKEGSNVALHDGYASFERTPIVGVDQDNRFTNEAAPGKPDFVHGEVAAEGATYRVYDRKSSNGVGGDVIVDQTAEETVSWGAEKSFATRTSGADHASQSSQSPTPPGESQPGPESLAQPKGPSTVAPGAPPQAHPKIIKTADLALEVPSHSEAIPKVETIVTQHGGFVADATTQEQAGGALLGKIVIRVVPERFEALFAALKVVGRVEAENVKAADVTAEYVDLEARIKGLQITEERLQELIKNKSIVDKVSSLLEVEREVTRVRSQIEQLQGQLRVMADRIGLSTITVTLREPARIVPSASLSVEVSVVEAAAESLGKSLEALGGRLLSGKTSKRTDGTLMGEYQFTVSLARFGEMLAAIDTLGRVNERQVKDRQFSDAAAPWADKVKCGVGLTLYERTRQLPSATLRLEVDALDAALKALDAPLAAYDAAIISNQASRRDDGSSAADLKLRVPAGQFAGFIDSLAPLGRVTGKQVAGETGSIVGGAAAMPCEIALTLAEKPRQVPSGSMAIEVPKFEPARDALSALIAEKSVHVLISGSSQRTDGTWMGTFRLALKAADMDALVTRLESLGRVASRQISGLGLGDLSRSDPNAVGVIELTLAEKAAFAPEPERAGDSLRSRIRDGLAGLYTSLGLIAYGLVVMAPWVLIVLLGAWLITRRLRKAAPQPKAE